MGYFPFFVELNKKPCFVVGGGEVALRKATVLHSFGGQVTIITKYSESMKEVYDGLTMDGINVIYKMASVDVVRDYLTADSVVVAATNEEGLNHDIAMLARKLGCYVNCATSKEDSNFIFPAIIQKEGMNIGISSEGKSPAVTKVVKQRIEDAIPKHLGAIVEQLECVRPLMKDRVKTQAKRKELYYELLQYGFTCKKEMTSEAIEAIIKKYENE